jgi:hypothetical protein
MSSTASDPKENFSRKSEEESICLLCFSTVRCDQFLSLEVAEQIHSQRCVMGDSSPLLLRPAA